MPKIERRGAAIETGLKQSDGSKFEGKKRDKAADAALAAAMLSEGVPRPKQDGEKVHLSAFELTAAVLPDIHGQQEMDPLIVAETNEYLDESARRIGKTVETLSEKEYHDVLADKMTFYKWVVNRRIDNYIRGKKDSLRMLADETSKGVRSKDLLMEQSALRSGTVELSQMLRDLGRGTDVRKQQMQDALRAMDEDFDRALDGKVTELRASGVPGKDIPAAIVRFQGDFVAARSAAERKFLKEIQDWESASKKAIDDRRKDLDALGKEIEHQATVGVKREMVSVAARYGEVLKRVFKDNDDAIWLNKDGTFSVDQRWTTRKERAKVFQQIDRELDRVLADRAKDGGDKSRSRNDEALFEVSEIMAPYLSDLKDRFARTSGRDRDQLADRALLVARHQQKKGEVYAVDLGFALGLFKANEHARNQNVIPYATDLLRGIPKLSGEYPYNSDSLKVEFRRLIELIDATGENRSLWWKFGGRRSSATEYSKGVEDAFGAFVKSLDTKSDELYNAYVFLCDEKTQLPREIKDALLTTLYKNYSRTEEKVSVIRGYYLIPKTLEKDVLTGTSPDLRDAAAGQLSIHLKDWAKTREGKEQAIKKIDEMERQVEDGARRAGAEAREDFLRYTGLKDWQEREDAADERELAARKNSRSVSKKDMARLEEIRRVVVNMNSAA